MYQIGHLRRYLNKMKRLLLILTLSLLASCQSGGHWTAHELKTWHADYSDSPLYYQGSDESFHYFICRPVDNWVPVKVDREEITLEKEIKRESSSLGKFPGYYTVDPEDKFKIKTR